MSFKLEKRVSSKKSVCRRSKNVSFEEENMFIKKPTLIIKRARTDLFLLREREREGS